MSPDSSIDDAEFPEIGRLNHKWSGPGPFYCAQLYEHGDFPGVAVGNCPVCWPAVSLARLNMQTGHVYGCERGCPEQTVRAAWLASGENEREALADEWKGRHLHHLGQALRRAQVAGYERGKAEAEAPAPMSYEQYRAKKDVAEGMGPRRQRKQRRSTTW